jgi:hypothetical protein
MASFTPLPGDAAGLQRYGAKYGSIAEAISEVSTKLRGLSNENWSKGDSIDALAERGKDVSSNISKAHARYHETALAIVEFSVALADAQADANEAIAANSSGSSTLGTLRYNYGILEDDRLTMLSAGAPQADIDDINDEIRRLDTKIDNAEYAMSQASTKYNQAEQDRIDAVQAAINRIRPALDALNDGLGDYIRSAFESVAEFLAAIGKWISEVLLPILAVLLLAVAAILLILVVCALLCALLFFLGPLALLVIGLVALIAIALVAMLAGIVIKGIAQPTPTMVPTKLPDYVGEDGLTDRERLRQQQGATEPVTGQTGDLLENGYLDSVGGEESTVIEVIKVVGEDGITRWRVILPSTQDWEMMNGLLDTPPNWDPKGDQGSMNDLGSNIMLMMTPAQEAAYQRAVRAAMLDAGVGPNDPVMMVGWSQGGILAGRFAENQHDEFNVQAIFVAGSPIDGMNIPSTVDVISVQHPDDVVHTLDFAPAKPNTNSWYTIAQAPQTTGNPPVSMADHSAASYAATADDMISQHDNYQLEYINQKQQVFYQGDQTVYAYQGTE